MLAIREISQNYGLDSDSEMHLTAIVLQNYPSNLIYNYNVNLYNYMSQKGLLQDDIYLKIVKRTPEISDDLFGSVLNPRLLQKLVDNQKFGDILRIFSYRQQNMTSVFLQFLNVLHYSHVWLGQKELVIGLKLFSGQVIKKVIAQEKTSAEIIRKILDFGLILTPQEFPNVRRIQNLSDPEWYDASDIFLAFKHPEREIAELITFEINDTFPDFAKMIWEDRPAFIRARDILAEKVPDQEQFLTIMNCFAILFGRPRKSAKKINEVYKLLSALVSPENIKEQIYSLPEKQFLTCIKRLNKISPCFPRQYCRQSWFKMQIMLIKSGKFRRLVKSKTLNVPVLIPTPDCLPVWSEILNIHGAEKIKEFCMLNHVSNIFSAEFLIKAGYSGSINEKMFRSGFLKYPPKDVLLDWLRFSNLNIYQIVSQL